MMDTIRTQQDLGSAVRRLRRQRSFTQAELSARAGRSRDVLYRLESGKDVNVSALMDFLAAMGATIELRSSGMPTLQEMRERFADDDDTGDDHEGKRNGPA